MTSRYPPFAVTADTIVFTVVGKRLHLVLIERAKPPFPGAWALPGGFVDIEEDLPEASVRELEEETGLRVRADRVRQLGAYGTPDRDPRMRTVGVAFWTAIWDTTELSAGSDAASALLVQIAQALDDPARLAFDHHGIITDAVKALSLALERTTVGTEFCPPEFTTSQLRIVYEAVWDVSLDPANFHKKVTAMEGFLEPTEGSTSGWRGRPAQLYRKGPASLLDRPFRPRSL